MNRPKSATACTNPCPNCVTAFAEAVNMDDEDTAIRPGCAIAVDTASRRPFLLTLICVR